MAFLSEYGLFLAKTLTIALAIVFVVIIILAAAARQRADGRHKGQIQVTRLNDELDDLRDDIRHEILDQFQLKEEHKGEKKKDKEERKAKRKAAKASEPGPERKRIFVLDFDGDTRASAVEELRHVITGVLAVARPEFDEVLLRLQSPGGMVHEYGLAASQVSRLRKHGIPLTICVDRVAASGGYMMACVANHLIAAPFAYIGSIGVLLQVPNVHRLLKDNKVDFEMITAGEYKRTLTAFGENTEAGRRKVQEEVDEMHALFKAFIQQYRPALALDKVATGEVWTGSQSLERGLVDALDTSDEWLVAQSANADLFQVHWEQKRKLGDRLSHVFEGAVQRALHKSLDTALTRADKERFYS